MPPEKITPTGGGNPPASPTGGDNDPASPTGSDNAPAPPTSGGNDSEEMLHIPATQFRRRLEREAKKLSEAQVEQMLQDRIRATLEEKGIDPDKLDDVPRQAETIERSWKSKVTKLENVTAELKQENAKLKAERKQDRIHRFITETVKTADTKVFVKVARDHFDLDDSGAIVVKDEDGNLLDGEDPTKFLKKLLDEHPTLAPPIGEPGAGSRPGNGSAARVDVSKLPFEHPDAKRYRLSEIAARYGK